MKKITVVGGDNRLKILKNELSKKGYAVDSLGLFPDDLGDYTSSDIVIFPVPTTKDSKTVFCPLTDRKLLLLEMAEKLSPNQLILSCNYTFENKKCVDYGALDSYALLNAVPTAEGAIKIAIDNTPYTLWKSNILIIGYGRVGKVLADRLKALGANVTVSARKPSDFGLLEAMGFDYINTGGLNSNPPKYDIIFNTVDVKIMDDKTLEKIKCDLIIDLSTFGAFSLGKAEELGIKTIKAPSLPSKTAPKTAAEILLQTITHIINS